MSDTQVHDKMDILSLPKHILSNIGSWLDDKEVSKMELASKIFYNALSSSCGPPRARLNLGVPVGPDKLWMKDEAPPTEAPYRWLQKRAMRYCHIVSDFCDANMLETEDVGEGTPGRVVPPLLPSLLAACAPSTEFKLHVAPDQGLLVCRREVSGRPVIYHRRGCMPSALFILANLQQHLTELMIEVQPGKGNKQLESLGSLTALKLLMILPEGPYRPGPPRYDMSGAKLVLNLPNLVFLFVCSLSNGELVLSGPRVEHAWFMNNKSFKVSMMELHDLDCLIMKDCKEIQVAGDALEKQFPKFKSLIVSSSIEVGRLVLEDIGKMQRLVQVSYSDFRASRMPASFPQSLEDIHLNPSGWFRDLPAGLKQCTKLKTLDFCTNRESVYFTKPWTELVPTDSLEKVSLGQTEYVRESDAGKAVFKQVSRLGDIMGL